MAERDGGRTLIELLLGPCHEPEPPSAELVRRAAGTLDPARAGEVDGFAKKNQALARAAAAGIDEIARQEGGGHAVLAVDLPPLRAAAATDAAGDPAPVPEDRRVLAEEPGRFRLVYYRLAGRACVTLALLAPGAAAALRVRLDGVDVAVAAEDGVPAPLTAVLGPAAALVGRRLVIDLDAAGAARALSFTLVPAAAP
jgi:hypothetical protein